MNPDDLKEALQSRGWKIENASFDGKHTGVSWYAWKRLDAATDCTCNERPPGLLLVPWDIAMRDAAPFRQVEFHVAGEVGSDTWCSLKVYSVQMDKAVETIPRAAAILLAAWNAAAGTETE